MRASDDTAGFAFNVTPLLRQSAAERVVTQLISAMRAHLMSVHETTAAAISKAAQPGRQCPRKA